MGSPTFSFAIALVLTEAGFLVTERVFEALLMAQGRDFVYDVNNKTLSCEFNDSVKFKQPPP